METLLADVRYGARFLLKSPGVVAVIVLTLALGIGANTAIFSVINAVLLRPLPYPEAERLVTVWEHKADADNAHNTVAPANYLVWKDESDVFERLAAFVTTRSTITGDGSPEEVTTQYVTEDFFPALGVPPLLGRTLTLADCTPQAPDVVVLSYGYWQRRFGGRAGVIGQKLTQNARSAEIIGVMPAGFTFQVREWAFTGGPPEIWGAIAFGPQHRKPVGRYLSALGLLKRGVSLQRAGQETDAIAARLTERFPEFDTGWGIVLVPLREQLVGAARPVLLLLLAAVGVVLLIACANVANMLLARAAGRKKEVAIRSALGAGRVRIARQLVTEAVLLAAVGGAGGLLCAVWGADLLVALAPSELLGLESVGLDWRVFGFAFVVSLATGLVFGLAPALQASKVDLNEAMKRGGGRGSADGRTRRLRETFVVSQVALSLVLLVGAGLLVRSLLRLQSVDPGFDPNQVLTFQVTLPGARYASAEAQVRFYHGLIGEIERVPGVRAASAVSALPLGAVGSATGFTIEGRPPNPPGKDPVTDVRWIEPGYFAAMRIPLLAGRGFTPQEAERASGVAIVSKAMALRHWPGESALGKRIVVDMKAQNTPSEIVGVVADVRGTGLDVEPREMVYWPHAELPGRQMSLVVRTQREPLALVPTLRRLVQGLDQDLPVAEVRLMDQLVAGSIARSRFSSLLLSLFAVVAALIAAVGLYGVLSHAVVQRRKEIGIRMALGAARADVLRMILSRGMLLAGLGIAAGLVLSVALARTVEGFLFGTSPTDPLTLAAIALSFAAVALVACYGPARRAARLDAMNVLRQD